MSKFDVTLLYIIQTLCWIIFGSLGTILYRVIVDKRQRKKRKKTYESVPIIKIMDCVFRKKKEADEALSALISVVWDYGHVTLADFYQMVGITPSFKDNKYGWNDLKGAYIKHIPGGYVLILPKMQVLGDVEKKYEQRV